ncbi:hypothetical protein [Nostoc sp. CMAA1605]|uniref:hypothetical protein n=1 Tax=Nostoc sp. CMAA1605 TaxID=2055159 RepID=UPI001F25AB18|nr:hypothetical protein [Nostoc sp. CMAA1605]MCF4968294.1 hypothetical protein [Nostoc sp. CMAA1605]
MPDQYQTVEEIKYIIESFHNCTLPCSHWDHHAHLTVALWYLTHYPQAEAIHLIREGIKKYNKSLNIPTTNNRGYHETMTLFWLYLVNRYLKQIHINTRLLTMTNQLIHHYGNKDLIFDYYSKELIRSGNARQNWVNPDLQKIDVEY